MADTGVLDETGEQVAKESGSAKRLREQTRVVKDDVRELGRLTREASQEKLEQAKDYATEHLEKGRQRVDEFEDSVVRYVREKPMKSVCLAAAAGALLGFLLSRR